VKIDIMGFNVLKKNLNNVVGKENFILVWNIYKIHLEKKKKKIVEES
jgi:hypothetical protein